MAQLLNRKTETNADRLFTRIHPDVACVAVLVGLWLLFFWRLLTPITADQASLKQGDFTGQFVTFAAYQYERFAAGEIPLWNPYNNGGLPFIADTQAAVFYPPRLLTIALAQLSGGFSGHALELEMTAHVLLASLFMYALLRRMLHKNPGSYLAGLVAAIIFSYGGFLTSYPPLQLALLEAAIWLPLALIGVLEFSRGDRPRYGWLLLTALAYGLSWMAGHPQTTWFQTYVLVAYLGYRVYEKRFAWWHLVGGAALFGLLGGGLAAVQLLPGFEYLAWTTRAGFSYDLKGNGFPVRDLAQFIFPGILSLFSPLYIGITGLALALLAIWRRGAGALFWGVVAVIALGLSLGENSAIFPALYNLMPGLRFFRGQERAAYVVATSLAILAGIGACQLYGWKTEDWPIATRNLKRGILALVGLTGGAVVLVFNEWLVNTDRLNPVLSVVLLSAMLAGATYGLLRALLTKPGSPLLAAAFVALIVFNLFTVNMDSAATYDPVPAAEQVSFSPPPLAAQALADTDGVFRVDGYRVLGDNYGSLYNLMDIRGISPLFMAGPHELIQRDLINPLAWELFAVRYVYTDWEQLPVSASIVGEGADRLGAVRMHRLENPRPFALVIHRAEVIPDTETALARLLDTSFDPRSTLLLEREPGIELSDASVTGQAEVIAFQPERITIQVSTSAPSLLSVALPYYPGWVATVNGEDTPILKAYTALVSIPVGVGEHEVVLRYDPPIYRLGAWISGLAWLGLSLATVWAIRRRSHPVRLPEKS
jgi:hypothetical protein